MDLLGKHRETKHGHDACNPEGKRLTATAEGGSEYGSCHGKYRGLPRLRAMVSQPAAHELPNKTRAPVRDKFPHHAPAQSFQPLTRTATSGTAGRNGKSGCAVRRRRRWTRCWW